MGKSTPPDADRAAELIDEIGAANRVLWCSQARQAALMVEFCDARKAADKQIITDRRTTGADPMFKAGEFAAGEVSLAVKTSKFITQRTIAMTRRVQSEAPDVWDAWEHGDIDNDKVVRVNRALRRLVHDRSKELLNTLVVPVAIEKTPEILGRWLNQFIAEVEPDETDERLRRSFDDRYVSVRPDIDGISFLHAALSSVDAVAVDQILNALACIAEPGDERTKQQRRADALVDLLCGRISNGCHTGYDTTTGFDTNTDTDDHLDDNPPDQIPAKVGAVEASALNGEPGPAAPAEARQDESEPAGDSAPGTGGGNESGSTDGESSSINGKSGSANQEFGPAHAESGSVDDESGAGSEGQPGTVGDGNPDPAEDHSHNDRGVEPGGTGDDEAATSGPADTIVVATDELNDLSDRLCSHTDTECSISVEPADHGSVNRSCNRVDDHTEEPWDANDWDLPATAFRPDPHASLSDTFDHQPDESADTDTDTASSTATPARLNTPPPAVQPRPPAVTIGVVVTAQSLFGYTNMPGQLVDRSALVPADTVRDLAQQPGTLFYRLLTDQTGNLLDVTEMGRFPSRKLDTAVKFRTGICGQPSCHHPADRCDLDHLTPVPEGATTGSNLAPACRHDHRAKTHAGHITERIGPGTTRWTTPTGHTYLSNDQPFPVDQWPETG